MILNLLFIQDKKQVHPLPFFFLTILLIGELWIDDWLLQYIDFFLISGQLIIWFTVLQSR